MEFEGIAVPVLTMFTGAMDVDVDAQALLTRHVIANSADVLFLCGSTGEGQFIQHERPNSRVLLVQAARDAMAAEGKNVPILFGIYGNLPEEVTAEYETMERATGEAGIELTIDGYVIAPPVDRQLDDDELGAFFTAIIEQITHPVFLYNNPATFGNNSIPIPVYENLISAFPNVVGIKDSSKELDNKFAIIDLISSHAVSFYTGSEGDFFKCLQAAPAEAAVRVGCIPSIGNILGTVTRIRQAFLEGNFDAASILQDQLNEIRGRLYHEADPKGKAQRGLKFALARLYPGTSLDIPVRVIPDYEREMDEESASTIAAAVDEPIEREYLVRVPV
jgi:4-hydroxy-tetrahydrodipicolinate synthase